MLKGVDSARKFQQARRHARTVTRTAGIILARFTNCLRGTDGVPAYRLPLHHI